MAGVDGEVGGDLVPEGRNWHKPRELTDEERAALLVYVEAHRGDDKFSFTKAAQEIGVRNADIKLTRKEHEDFDEEVRNARGYGTEAVMNAMVRLAINGVDEPIVSAGKLVTDPETGKPMVKRVYDSRAAIELFKALTPDGKAMLAGKLGIEISGPDGGPVEVQRGVELGPVAAMLLKAGVDLAALAAGVEKAELEAAGAGEVVEESDEELQ